MGRGRAKAKQTKVARDLKYRTHETDFGALAKELRSGEDGFLSPTATEAVPDDADEDELEDDADWSGHADRPQRP